MGNAKRIYIEFIDVSDVKRYYSSAVLDADANEEPHCIIYEAENFTLEDAAQSVQTLDSQGDALERPRLELGVRLAISSSS